MINYFVFFFVLIFIVIYIYSLPRKEQFECRQIGHHAITEADKTDKKPCLDIDINAMSDFETLSYYNNLKSINSSKKDYKSINIHVINFEEDNVNNYINEVFVNNVIINSLNDIGQSKYVLKSLVNEDYKHNLRRYYHNWSNRLTNEINKIYDLNQMFDKETLNRGLNEYYRYDKTVKENDSYKSKYSINDFVNNDVSILRKMLISKDTISKVFIESMLKKMITNNEFNNNSNNKHIIFVPYITNNILKLNNMLIIVGMYDISCKCYTIPRLPSKLRKNWITHYFSISKYKPTNKVSDEEEYSVKKIKNELDTIKKHIRDIENDYDYIKNKEKYDTIMYTLKKMYSKDYMVLPEVRQYNNLSKIHKHDKQGNKLSSDNWVSNKKKRDTKIKELKDIDKLEIKRLETESSGIKKKIEDYTTSTIHSTKNYTDKSLLELKKMEKETYDTLVKVFNENETANKKQCKLDIINEKQNTKNNLYISKHTNYINDLIIVFKLANFILDDYSIQDQVLLEFGTNFFDDDVDNTDNNDNTDNVDNNDNKCDYSINIDVCNESKLYENDTPLVVKAKYGEQDYIDGWDSEKYNKFNELKVNPLVTNISQFDDLDIDVEERQHIPTSNSQIFVMEPPPKMIKFSNSDNRPYIL